MKMTSDDTERPGPLKDKFMLPTESLKWESQHITQGTEGKDSVSQGAEWNKGKAEATAFIGVSVTKSRQGSVNI